VAVQRYDPFLEYYLVDIIFVCGSIALPALRYWHPSFAGIPRAVNRPRPIFLSPIIARCRDSIVMIRGLSRSSKFSIKISHGIVGLWVYADFTRGVCGFTRTPWSERRASVNVHVTAQQNHHVALLYRTRSVKRFNCGMALPWFLVILWKLMELSSELPIASGAVVKWQTSPESGGVLLMITGPSKRRMLPGKLLFLLVSYTTVHKRPPIYINCNSWRFSEKTSQVSYIDDRFFCLLTVYAA
jgi:hypothetical protein